MICAGLIELAGAGSSTVLSFRVLRLLRAFRLLRLLRALRMMSEAQDEMQDHGGFVATASSLIQAVGAASDSILYMFMLLMLFIYVFAAVGMQIFYEVRA